MGTHFNRTCQAGGRVECLFSSFFVLFSSEGMLKGRELMFDSPDGKRSRLVGAILMSSKTS